MTNQRAEQAQQRMAKIRKDIGGDYYTRITMWTQIPFLLTQLDEAQVRNERLVKGLEILANGHCFITDEVRHERILELWSISKGYCDGPSSWESP